MASMDYAKATSKDRVRKYGSLNAVKFQPNSAVNKKRPLSLPPVLMAPSIVTELQEEACSIKIAISHICAARDTPQLLTQINSEFEDNPPIRNITHLNRLVNLSLPWLQNRLTEIYNTINPAVHPRKPPQANSPVYNKWTEWKKVGPNSMSREIRTTSSPQPWDVL